MLLRIRRRREAFTNADLQEVIETEFEKDGEPDLAVSVYEIPSDDSTLVQCHAEHSASANIDPKGGSHVDLKGLSPREPVAIPDSRFTYARATHREIRLDSLDELRVLVARLMAEVSDRQHVTEKAQLKEYATSRAVAGDPEWLAFLRECPRSRALKWVGAQALGAL
jgi:hypothetical protein